MFHYYELFELGEYEGLHMGVMQMFGEGLFALNVCEWEDGVCDYFRTQRFKRRHTVFVAEDLGNVSSLWITPPN